MTAPQMGVALRCVGLSKTFRIYLRPMDILRELLTGRAHAVERQALADISLDVYRGEVVGILGRNGAGKSTLLKIVAGTLDRTAGSVETHGRITAILELGTGFHPDYSGRENIKLGGLCMGMTPAEVARKTDTIIEFSELRDVIDQPFRTYSTGMQARLTFATAISVDPDILVVDEALAVGDARFQMRCFARISELRARGCTILLVSHDISTITQFCDRAVILEQGRIHTIGTAKEVASKYLRLLFEPKNTALAVPVAPSAEATDGSGPTAGARFGDGAMKLTGYEWLDEAGQPIQVLQTGQRCQFRMTAVAVRPVEAVSCGFAIKNRLGTVLFGMTNISSSQPMTNIAVGETLEITSDLVMWLSAGDYFVNFGFGHADGELSDFIDSGLHFTVHGPGNIFTTAVVNLQATYRIARRPREAPESAPATPRSGV